MSAYQTALTVALSIMFVVGSCVLTVWVRTLRVQQQHLATMAALFGEDAPLVQLHAEAVQELERRKRLDGKVDRPDLDDA